MKLRNVGLVMLAAMSVATSSAMGVTFTALSTGNPTFSGIVANDISPDGSVVVGTALKSGNTVKTPFLYNVATATMYDLGDPNGSTTTASAAVGVGITSGGTVWIAVNATNIVGKTQAYLWSGDSSGVGAYTGDDIRYDPLGANPGDNSTATSLAVQIGDEVMVCGNWTSGTTQKGFRYRTLPSFLDLDKPPTSNYANNAYGISVFGDIGGYSSNCQVGGGNHRNSWTWTSSTYQWLANLEGGPNNVSESQSRGVGSYNVGRIMSLDGLTVVGRSTITTDNNWHVFRQIPGTTLVGSTVCASVADIHTNTLNGQTYSEGTAVNGYGTVVAGYAMNLDSTNKTLFVWDAANNMRDLITLAGSPAGWVMTNVTGLSQDGAAAVGLSSPVSDSGTGTVVNLGGSPATSTVEDLSKAWAVDQWKNYTCYIAGSSGYTIAGNTATKLTVNGTPPAGSQTYRICTGSDSWIATSVYSPPLPPPAPSIATPSNDTWVAGVPYTKNVVLGAGRLPVPGWSVLQGPAGLAVAPAGKGATVSNWTPDSSNIGTPVTIQVQASSTGGTATASWTVTVVPPAAPRIVPQLIVGATTITVDKISTYATEVAVYKNGAKTYSRALPGNNTSPASVTFDNTDGVTPLANPMSDWYEAEQTSGGAASLKWPTSGVPYRMVLPTTMSFADDFETGTGGPGTWSKWWLRADQAISSAQARTGTYSVFEDVTGLTTTNGNNFADATAGASDGLYREPVIMEFWMYENAINTTTGSRHRAGIYQYNFGGWEPGVAGGASGLQYIMEIGTFPGNDSTRYQCRVVINGTTWAPGTGGNTDDYGTYPNLGNDTGGLAPVRSAGWHKFSIVAGANKCWFYVDGKRGIRMSNVSPTKLNVVRVGNETGSPDYDAGVPGSGDCYYDGATAAKVVQHDPTLTLVNITGSVGQAITPTAESASDVDTPDTVKLVMSGSLPAGLVADATTVEVGSTPSAGPTATITISGTPAAGTEGVYTVNFTATDDLVSGGGGTATGSITITIGACVAPTITPPVVPNNAVTGTNPVNVAITGTNFVNGGTSVKLQKTGQSDIVGSNVSVTGTTGLTADFNLTGAATGKWDVVVTTCASATAAEAFEVKAACNTPPQDYDGDGDVDLTDFSTFAACFNGPNNPWPGPPIPQQACDCSDQDNDLDVDLADFSSFSGCFNGPNNPPSCP